MLKFSCTMPYCLHWGKYNHVSSVTKMSIFGKCRRLSAIYQKFSHSLMVLAFTKSGLKKFGSGFLFKILNDFNSMALYKAVSQIFTPVFAVNIDHKSSL